MPPAAGVGLATSAAVGGGGAAAAAAADVGGAAAGTAVGTNPAPEDKVGSAHCRERQKVQSLYLHFVFLFPLPL